MRFFALFLVTFTAFSAALWLLVDPAEPPPDLPDRPPPESGPAVLVGADLADEHGRAPFAGEVRRLSGVVLRLLDEKGGYERYHVRFGRLARGERGPRIEGIECAVFDEPVDGTPNLRLTIEGRFAEADAGALLRGASKDVRVHGGITVRDAQGRTLAEIEAADLDLEARTIEAMDAVVHLRYPDEQAQVRGLGLRADLGLRRAELLHDVAGSVRSGEQLVTFGCAGPATASEDDGEIVVSLEGGARIEHSFGRATAERIVVHTEKSGRQVGFLGAELDGDVVMALDPEKAEGLERVAAQSVSLRGEDEAVFDGPVAIAWRGAVEWLGAGERTVDLRAGKLVLRRESNELSRAEFTGGFEARDRDGVGVFSADSASYDLFDELLVAGGKVHAVTPDATVDAAALRLRGKAESLVAELDGPVRLAFRKGDRPLALRCATSLRFARKDDGYDVEARGEVDAKLGETALRAGRLVAAIAGKELTSLLAEEEVSVDDAARDARLRGAKLAFDGKVWRAAGGPARIEAGERTLSARALSYDEDDGTFETTGDVEVEAVFGGGAWRLRCGTAKGALTKDGDLLRVLAEGEVDATGPEGERIRGASLRYDAASGKAVLLGEPARVARSDEVEMESGGFDLTVADGAVVAARTRGKGELLYRPGGEARVERWRVGLDGPAVLEEDRVTVADGARLDAYGADDRLLVRATARHVVLTLARTESGGFEATLLQGSGGVFVQTDDEKVTARTLEYRPGTGQVDVRGDGHVDAKDWPQDVTFDHLVFVLGDEGVDLKRASGVVVRKQPR